MMRLALIAGILIAGCHKRPYVSDSSSSPTDPMPIVLAAISSGMELSYMAGELAKNKQDFTGCVVGHSMAAALATASEGLRGNIKGGLIPAIEYDISACLPILKDSGTPSKTDVPAMVKPLVSASLVGLRAVVNGYKGDMKCENRAWLLASLDYANGAVPGIISEISEPDGKLSIPETSVDLRGCASKED